MVLIVLGGAQGVWDDYRAAARLCPVHDVAAVNEAGRDYEGHLTLWCSLHPEKLGDWQLRREKAGRNTDYTAVSHKEHAMTRVDRVVNEIWPGSSGLYACQVGAITYGYQRLILCGIRIDASPHYHGTDPWDGVRIYRRGWMEATDQPELRGRIRSMSGWTADYLGTPDKDWL